MLPRLVDLVLGRAFEETRARVAAGVSGQVLEVGFGSGRNVPHYPDTVTRVRAVDPATGARGIAARRIAASSIPVEFVGSDGQDLPLPTASVDHVLITWSLCTIPDPARALAEVHRVLRPGGGLHFVEHGRAPDPRTTRWQDRLTPARSWAAACVGSGGSPPEQRVPQTPHLRHARQTVGRGIDTTRQPARRWLHDHHRGLQVSICGAPC